MGGIILNEDCNHFIHSRHLAGVKVNESVLREFISQYKDTQVTDMVINPNGMMSFSPSDVRETVLAKYLAYKAAGKIDETNCYGEVLNEIYVNQGLDMYAVWFDQCRQDGLTSWLSVRMNDCHVNGQDDHILLTEYYKTNKHLRRVTHHDSYDNYFNNCIDYGQEHARQYYLDYIQECLDRYDVDGLELDWMREIFCFKLGQEYQGIEIVNNFMRTVKAKVDAASVKRGHSIKLSVRLPHSPITALKLGFDVMTWIHEKLVDLVIPTARWESTDNDMAIDFWKRLVDGKGVSLAGGMEIAMRSYPNAPMKPLSLEMAMANALMILSAGADKVYLFNFMDIVNDDFGKKYLPDYALLPQARSNYNFFLKSCGSIATLLHHPRRHAVTYHDIEAPGVANSALLPLTIDSGAYRPVRIETGVIPPDKTITLIIAAHGESDLAADDFRVFVNSQAVRYLGPVAVPLAYSQSPHYGFAVTNYPDFPQASIAEFAAGENPYRIDHVELRVD